MAEVTNQLVFDTLIGLRADVAEVKQDVRALRAEVREQCGVLARRLDAVEARLTRVERVQESHTIGLERLDRKFDIVVAALSPVLPADVRRALLAEDDATH